MITESSTELESRQSELSDSVVGAPDSAPVAWSRQCGGVPATQRAEWVVKVELEGSQGVDLGLSLGAALGGAR